MPIFKARREWFGAVIYSEHPGFTAFVDHLKADALGVPPSGPLPHGRLRAPLDVHLAITSRCNQHCRGCYVGGGAGSPTDLALDQARRILERLARWEVFTVALGGGEPLLHPEVFAIADCARVNGIVPNLTTNGTCLDPTMARRCRIFGSVHLSCHDYGELPWLESACRHLQGAGIDPGLNLLVSTATYGHLEGILTWCRRMRIGRVLFLKFKLTEQNRECADMRLTWEQERSLMPVLSRLCRRFGLLPMLDCSLLPSLAADSPKHKDLRRFDVNGCQGGTSYLAITPAGVVKPCSFSDLALGGTEVLETGFWGASPALERFRRWRAGEDCASCSYLEFCNGGCRVCEQPGCAGRS